VAGLRPDWRDAERSTSAGRGARRHPRAAAADRCDRCEADALRERLARAHALLRHAAAEVARHRRLLASASRRAAAAAAD
jgi:hypothetical protein